MRKRKKIQQRMSGHSVSRKIRQKSPYNTPFNPRHTITINLVVKSRFMKWRSYFTPFRRIKAHYIFLVAWMLMWLTKLVLDQNVRAELILISDYCWAIPARLWAIKAQPVIQLHLYFANLIMDVWISSSVIGVHGGLGKATVNALEETHTVDFHLNQDW